MGLSFSGFAYFLGALLGSPLLFVFFLGFLSEEICFVL